MGHATAKLHCDLCGTRVKSPGGLRRHRGSRTCCRKAMREAVLLRRDAFVAGLEGRDIRSRALPVRSRAAAVLISRDPRFSVLVPVGRGSGRVRVLYPPTILGTELLALWVQSRDRVGIPVAERDETGWVVCPICDGRCPSKAAYLRHFELHHAMGESG